MTGHHGPQKTPPGTRCPTHAGWRLGHRGPHNIGAAEAKPTVRVGDFQPRQGAGLDLPRGRDLGQWPLPLHRPDAKRRYLVDRILREPEGRAIHPGVLRQRGGICDILHLHKGHALAIGGDLYCSRGDCQGGERVAAKRGQIGERPAGALLDGGRLVGCLEQKRLGLE
jgi:hypothetical protein